MRLKKSHCGGRTAKHANFMSEKIGAADENGPKTLTALLASLFPRRSGSTEAWMVLRRTDSRTSPFLKIVR